MFKGRGYTIVDGEDKTGLYAADGTYNVVNRTDDDPVTACGVYHPCGAYNVVFDPDSDKVYHSSGALIIKEEAP